ncbi:MAG: outer membrane lipoprotein carrier protein LolA [Mesorhizobium sp.]
MNANLSASLGAVCRRAARFALVLGITGAVAGFAGASYAPVSPVAQASAAAADAAQKIANHFSSVKTMSGEFVQFGPRGEKTGGTFMIERPGKIRFNYEAPSNFRVVSDGKQVLILNTKLRTADMYPLSKTPLKLLLDDQIDLSGKKLLKVTEDPDLTTIVLQDKSVFGDSRITLMFDPKSYELRQWTVTDAQGKDTTVMIYNLQQGVKLDSKQFAIDYREVDRMNQSQTPGR